MVYQKIHNLVFFIIVLISLGKCAANEGNGRLLAGDLSLPSSSKTLNSNVKFYYDISETEITLMVESD